MECVQSIGTLASTAELYKGYTGHFVALCLLFLARKDEVRQKDMARKRVVKSSSNIWQAPGSRSGGMSPQPIVVVTVFSSRADETMKRRIPRKETKAKVQTLSFPARVRPRYTTAPGARSVVLATNYLEAGFFSCQRG